MRACRTVEATGPLKDLEAHISWEQGRAVGTVARTFELVGRTGDADMDTAWGRPTRAGLHSMVSEASWPGGTGEAPCPRA